MAEAVAVRRIVHIRVRIPGTDVNAILTLIRAGIPFYQASAKARVRLLKNADDPAQFVQIMEYESDAGVEASRQKIASDPMIQAYLQIWRTISMAAVEVDVYEDVTEAMVGG